MKVFVYTKEPQPKKVAVINDVREVTEYKGNKMIIVRSRNGVDMTFDTRKVKTTIYQN